MMLLMEEDPLVHAGLILYPKQDKLPTCLFKAKDFFFLLNLFQNILQATNEQILSCF